jgi:hypothetical protein
VDQGGFIIASERAESGVDDASVGVAMLDRIESSIERFTADGAYETRAIYEVLQEAESPIPINGGSAATVRTLVRGEPSSQDGVVSETQRGLL